MSLDTMPIRKTGFTATYSPDDNKLRLYASTRLDRELYARVKAAGFIWAPKQDLFVASSWSPAREDLLMELAGEVGDEDTSLVDRAEDRAERFDDYGERRTDEAHRAREAVSAIADQIPLGQPILVGHHSERHARRDAERIRSGMQRAVNLWRTAEYWRGRAHGAIRHAKYKERPDVRARRIKGLEADERKLTKTVQVAEALIRLWAQLDDPYKDGRPCDDELRRGRAVRIANAYDHGYYAAVHTHASGYVGPLTYHSALTTDGVSPGDVAAVATRNNEAQIARTERWIEHTRLRLEYERTMLVDAGGTVADRTGPEKGGACRCWATQRGRASWSLIVKLNKVSVTVLDNWGNGGKDFTRTIPFDKLTAIMSRADVDAARAAGRLLEESPRGFVLLPEPAVTANQQDSLANQQDTPAEGTRIDQVLPTSDEIAFGVIAETLRAGVQVVTAPQLFPTPVDVARQVVGLADVRAGHLVLEPSAGLGGLIDALNPAQLGVNVYAIELVAALAGRLRGAASARWAGRVQVVEADFLAWSPPFAPDVRFDRIVMNPPFTNGADLRHIDHAFGMLGPGGRLVAICAAGPRQVERLKPLATEWIDLPRGTFAGTDVAAAICVLDRDDA